VGGFPSLESLRELCEINGQIGTGKEEWANGGNDGRLKYVRDSGVRACAFATKLDELLEDPPRHVPEAHCLSCSLARSTGGFKRVTIRFENRKLLLVSSFVESLGCNTLRSGESRHRS
jgi:hypothetical protein